MSLERCIVCGGSGFKKCSLCQGGELILDKKDPSITDECPECRGKGQVTCPGCMGTGYVDMPTFA